MIESPAMAGKRFQGGEAKKKCSETMALSDEGKKMLKKFKLLAVLGTFFLLFFAGFEAAFTFSGKSSANSFCRSAMFFCRIFSNLMAV